jgi:predicted nuclease of predicted toxin-antitoxin system
VKILIDMNLSPEWVPFLRQAGFESAHWSAVGDSRATDAELMEWARTNDAGAGEGSKASIFRAE